MTSLRLYSLVLAGSAVAAVGVAAWVRRRSKTEVDLERDRRQWLAAAGRIIDGTVTDVQEIAGDGSVPVQLLFYHHDVAGVEYEASQDVTYLRHYIDVHSCRLGLPASVKYDPHNPGNSIVISEAWSGLRR
jgi:hypothetical protein